MLDILEFQICTLETSLLGLNTFDVYESVRMYYFKNALKLHEYDMTLMLLKSVESTVKSLNSIRKSQTQVSDIKIPI
jgi:hypothetical protein